MFMIGHVYISAMFSVFIRAWLCFYLCVFYKWSTKQFCFWQVAQKPNPNPDLPIFILTQFFGDCTKYSGEYEYFDTGQVHVLLLWVTHDKHTSFFRYYCRWPLQPSRSLPRTSVMPCSANRGSNSLVPGCSLVFMFSQSCFVFSISVVLSILCELGLYFPYMCVAVFFLCIHNTFCYVS